MADENAKQTDARPWKPGHIVLPPTEAVAEAVARFISDPVNSNQEFDRAARRAVHSAIIANNAIEHMMEG